jgi:hypothetical protein
MVLEKEHTVPEVVKVKIHDQVDEYHNGSKGDKLLSFEECQNLKVSQMLDLKKNLT